MPHPGCPGRVSGAGRASWRLQRGWVFRRAGRGAGLFLPGGPARRVWVAGGVGGVAPSKTGGFFFCTLEKGEGRHEQPPIDHTKFWC